MVPLTVLENRSGCVQDRKAGGVEGKFNVNYLRLISGQCLEDRTN